MNWTLLTYQAIESIYTGDELGFIDLTNYKEPYWGDEFV